MNIRKSTGLVALAMGLALSATPLMAGPKVMEIGGLKMEVDVIELKASKKVSPAARSSKPKEIVVVGSKDAKPRAVEMNSWLEAAQSGN